MAVDGALAAGGDRGALLALPAKVVLDVGRVDEGGAPPGAVVAPGASGVPLLLSQGSRRKTHPPRGTNPPGVSLNRLELKKQMRYFFRAKIFCVLKKNVLGKFLA
jgi:hypothetical protein